jgi:hypothetical protein
LFLCVSREFRPDFRRVLHKKREMELGRGAEKRLFINHLPSELIIRRERHRTANEMKANAISICGYAQTTNQPIVAA